MLGEMTGPLLAAHAAATWFMVGLIWFVQLVHYPLMAGVSASVFREYSLAHRTRTTRIVAPMMLLEAVCAAVLAAGGGWGTGSDAGRMGEILPWLGAGLLVVVWASTFGVQVPLHGRLGHGFDDAVWRRLVTTNWVRTVCWTARGVVAVSMLRIL